MKPSEAKVLEKTMGLVWPFGKFKGIKIEDIPSSYLKWASTGVSNDTWSTAADIIWNYRESIGIHF